MQGVFFRASAVEQARARGVAGGVRNLPDGRVEAVFQGSPEAVAACVEWCRRGPPGARVSGVEEIPEVPIPEESDFHILW